MQSNLCAGLTGLTFEPCGRHQARLLEKMARHHRGAMNEGLDKVQLPEVQYM